METKCYLYFVPILGIVLSIKCLIQDKLLPFNSEIEFLGSLIVQALSITSILSLTQNA